LGGGSLLLGHLPRTRRGAWFSAATQFTCACPP
jgi:hypothetical protein